MRGRALIHRQVLPWLMFASLAACGLVAGGARRYQVSSESMEPTLTMGRMVTARRIAAGEYAPRRGIVVFTMPDSWDAGRHGIARVVAVGGELISCCDTQGRVMIDGQPLDESYVKYDLPMDAPQLDRMPVPPVRPGDRTVRGDLRDGRPA